MPNQVFGFLDYATGAVGVAALIMVAVLLVDTHRLWRKRKDGTRKD